MVADFLIYTLYLSPVAFDYLPFRVAPYIRVVFFIMNIRYFLTGLLFFLSFLCEPQLMYLNILASSNWKEFISSTRVSASNLIPRKEFKYTSGEWLFRDSPFIMLTWTKLVHIICQVIIQGSNKHLMVSDLLRFKRTELHTFQLKIKFVCNMNICRSWVPWYLKWSSIILSHSTDYWLKSVLRICINGKN